MEELSVKDFIENHMPKYQEAMKKLAHQPECLFRIHVYERTDDYIACLDNDKSKWEADPDLNQVIKKIKTSFPELSDEQGVKYYPLGKYYGQ